MPAEADSRRSINVAYLLSDLGGGTGHHLLSLLETTPAALWRAHIVSEAQMTTRVTPTLEVEILPDLGPLMRFPLGQLRRWLMLRKQFRESPPDVLHTYFFWSIIYGRLLKAEGIVRRLVENREDLGFNWSAPEYRLLRLTRRLPDAIICVSEAVRHSVVKREAVPESRTIVIRNGVARLSRDDSGPCLDLRAEFGIPKCAPVVGMVANFHRAVKGASYFVEALGLAARDIPDVRFLLIGMGTNQADLQRCADRAGVGSQLVFTGFREDVDRFYSLMDVSALTSLSEGLSITLLESMRHGVPVVATDVGGNREVVKHGETGYLVSPKDPAALAGRVVQLLRDPLLREEFGQNARRVVEAQFNLDAVANNYLQVYKSLLDGNLPG